jgi:hypothetical protein
VGKRSTRTTTTRLHRDVDRAALALLLRELLRDALVQRPERVVLLPQRRELDELLVRDRAVAVGVEDLRAQRGRHGSSL